MILLVDADSLIWSSCYRRIREEGQSQFFEDLSEAVDKFDEVLMSIYNTLDEQYGVDTMELFSGSRGNFRKLLDTNYKANRKVTEIPPLLGELQDYVKTAYNSRSEYGLETDDVVAKTWRIYSEEVGRNHVMIVSIDKDYKQLPCLMYNYHSKHKEVYDISEREAMYNFYEQMIVGDSADNVNFCKGFGKRYAEKYLADCDSQYDFTKRVYRLFRQLYKGKAKQKYIQCYHLLKLRTE